METRKLGGLTVSLVGLGCNNFGMRMDEAATKEVVATALDEGITLFDTADVYGGTKSEEFLGKALGKRRDDAIVATKFGAPLGEDKKGASADYIGRAVEDSLRRLGTDRIDLYQLHFPDNDTALEETLTALDKLVAEGKVREIGCSNFNGQLIDECTAISKDKGIARFVSAQNQINLLDRRQEKDVVAACERDGLGILPYFPLASGMLTGKYKRNEEPAKGTRLAGMPAERRERVLGDKTFDIVEGLERFATERGHTLLELAMSWLAGLPAMASVIAGATKPDQVRSNVASVGWKLTADERAEIDKLTAR